MSDELSRLSATAADHEARIRMQEDFRHDVSPKLDKILETLAVVVVQLKGVHTEDTCRNVREVREIAQRVRVLETSNDQAKGQEKTGSVVWMRVSAFIGWIIALGLGIAGFIAGKH